MNMTPVAQAVQRQGRGEDTMLVHMTPGEVGGLQALAMAHGGSLTINPKTGLPEAGFLKNLLPTLLGVGLSFIPGVGPMAAGMITGGIETVRTGDIGKGFLAGLGAYGGANLAGGLRAAGTQAAGLTSGAKALGTTPELISTPEGLAQALNAAPATSSYTAPALGQAGTLNPELVSKFASGVQAGTTQAAATPFQTTLSGAKNVLSSGAAGEGARSAALTNLGGYTGLAADVGMVAAPSLLAQPNMSMPAPKDEGFNYEGPYTPSERRVSYPTDDERRRRTSEFTYFVPSNPVPFERGGLASLARGGSVPQLEDGGFVLTKKAVDGLGKGSNKKGQENARRGLGAIPIKGPGTGTSDSIKTTIGGKHPARISNGEAYVPKRQVAKRGGAKAFYALMNRAEKAADKRKRA